MVAILLSLGFAVFVGTLWGFGIIGMKEKHPEYRGEEYLNWDRENDHWDDHKAHTEGEI